MPTADSVEPVGRAGRHRRDHRHAGQVLRASVSIGPMIAGSSAGGLARGLSLRARSIEMLAIADDPGELGLDLRRRVAGEDAAVDVGLDPLGQRVERVAAVDHRRDAGRAQHRVEALVAC